MKEALNWFMLIVSAAYLVVAAGFVLKVYWLLFMLGWEAIWPR